MQICHYSTSSGREPVKEFIAALPEDTRYELVVLLRRMESGEILPMPYSRSMASMDFMSFASEMLKVKFVFFTTPRFKEPYS